MTDRRESGVILWKFLQIAMGESMMTYFHQRDFVDDGINSLSVTYNSTRVSSHLVSRRLGLTLVGEPSDIEGGRRESQDPEGPEHLDGPAEQDQREPRTKGPS